MPSTRSASRASRAPPGCPCRSAGGLTLPATGSPAALSPGDRLGPYVIVGWLGSGGMGDVYRAHDGRLRRDVAVKVVRPSRVSSEFVERLTREARAAGALN